MSMGRDTDMDLAAMQKLAWESWMLSAEAGMVIWLRMMRLAGGGALAGREAERMVSEKLAAPWEIGMDFLRAPPPSPDSAARRSIRHYRRKVAANRRRLTRGRR